MRKIAVMFSGGIDSLGAILRLKWDGAEIKAVHVSFGYDYAAKELLAVEGFEEDLGLDLEIVKVSPRVSFPFHQDQVGGFIPNRNLFLASIGSWYADEICVAGIKGDKVEDKSAQAFLDMSRILTKFSRKKIWVFSPLWNITKGNLVRLIIENVENGEDLVRRTVGCYHPTKFRCGHCTSCFRSWVAMKFAGMDPRFDVSQELKDQYREKAAEGTYDSQRCFEILKTLEMK